MATFEVRVVAGDDGDGAGTGPAGGGAGADGTGAGAGAASDGAEDNAFRTRTDAAGDGSCAGTAAAGDGASAPDDTTLADVPTPASCTTSLVVGATDWDNAPFPVTTAARCLHKNTQHDSVPVGIPRFFDAAAVPTRSASSMAPWRSSGV